MLKSIPSDDVKSFLSIHRKIQRGQEGARKTTGESIEVDLWDWMIGQRHC